MTKWPLVFLAPDQMAILESYEPTETSLESTKEATDSTPCGIDLRLLTEVALLPPDPVSTYDLSSY